MQTIIAFGIAVLTAVTSQLLLKKGISTFDLKNFSPGGIFLLVKHVISSGFLMSGLLFYGISFIFWLIVLSKIKLSFAYPITSLNFVLILIASHYLFGERLVLLQYFGIMLIIFGIIFLSSR